MEDLSFTVGSSLSLTQLPSEPSLVLAKMGREFKAAQPDRELRLDLRSLRWRVKRYREDTMDLEMLNERTG